MRKSEMKDRSRLIAAAMQKIPCDLTVENVKLVNVFTGEIYPASVDVLDGYVVRVREAGQTTAQPSRRVYDGEGRYLIPGFIDTHMHCESTMMIPENMSRAIVPWGTTTVCTDPHEIGNVMGLSGVRFMLENGRKSALRHYVLAPSCVPAVPALEGAGASFTHTEVAELLDSEDVVGVAEIMDYVGVYNDDRRMHEIIDEGVKRDVLLQGHSPMASGKELAAYLVGGPCTDHESGSAEEVREKLRNGMHINLRASSIADALKHELEGCMDHRFHDNVSVCTDDVHAKDLLEKGHINSVVRKMIQLGVEPVDAIKMATLNAAREYNFKDLGAIAPGYIADMQLVDALDGNRPDAVFIRGELVARRGEYLGHDDPAPAPEMPNTVNMPQITCPEDFLLRAPEGCGDRVKVLVMIRTPESIIKTGEWVELPVMDGCVSLEGHDDLHFVCIANRYGAGDKSIAVLRCFGLREGAMATTISHDSHNFTVVYRDIESAYACAEEMKRVGGGMCAAKGGKVISTLALPVAGLMSYHPCEEVSREIEQTQSVMASLCDNSFSILALVVFALPVLPGLILTDRGMVDGLSQKFVNIFQN